MGHSILLCVPSTVAAVAVSLTCNGDGVGFRDVMRPSPERGTCAFCRYPSKSWVMPDASLGDSKLACSTVPVPESILSRGTSKGDGVAPKCYKFEHSSKTCRRVSGSLERNCAIAGLVEDRRQGLVSNDGDIGLAIMVRCHGGPQQLAVRCRWQAFTEKVH